MTIDAIITAGGIPEIDDPLYEYTKGIPKALLPIAGKPMIQWVLDAVNQCEYIDRVVVIGLPEHAALNSTHETIFIEKSSDMLTNIQTAAKTLGATANEHQRAFILASDVPAITVEMLNWMYDASKDLSGDVFYSIIEKQTMENRYPTANRTFIQLEDCQVCGGDVSIFRLEVVNGERPIWKRLIDARKNPIKQARLIGLGILVPLVTKKLKLKTAERKISRRLRIVGHVLCCPYAEIGMDVDKPHQFEILRAELGGE
ncbi:MAG: NTP transferase domain-containing protein [Anaerolineaceae bacterium]|nr:NTP transferase domain-containing protein [Anaerolineaceae bacterium]